MQNIDYYYVKMVIREREEGLRRAQLAGTAYEHRGRRRFSWPWARGAGHPAGATRVAPAS